ncbi:rolling circle replication-associated protein [Luteibacter jiangsuensis]
MPYLADGLPRPDVCGWWPYGSTKIETARNPIGYMVKYATKMSPDDLKRLPKHVRLHGNGGHTDGARMAPRESLLPTWAREHAFASRFLAASALRNALIEAGELDPSESLPSGSGFYMRPQLRSVATGEIFSMDFAIPVDAPALARCPGGGMVDLATGEVIPSRWLVAYERGALILTEKTELETTYECAA